MSARLILTAAPDYIDAAWAELEQVVSGEAARRELAPGVLLVSMAGPFSQPAQRWLECPPIFVRHICPANFALPYPALAGLRDLVANKLAGHFDQESPFSVQTRVLPDAAGEQDGLRPFDVNNALADLVAAGSGAPLDVRRPQQILSVVVARVDNAPVAYIGLSPAIYNLSNWAGGVRRFRREPEQISRAEFKLLEALEHFDVHLPARGVALDLGAAPGGWTRVLRQREQYVTAVDPGKLHPSLAGDTGVRHLRMTAETYLADDPDHFDLIMNDMRLDGRDSARLMVGYASCLRPQGLAIMTLKLPAERWEPVLDHSFNILRRAYQILCARQLFHNRSEVTLLLAKPGR